MVDVVIRKAVAEDIPLIGQHLRVDDQREADAYGFPFDATKALDFSYLHSLKSWTAELDGEPCCIFGVATASLLFGEGVPWMMGTPTMDRGYGILVRETPRYIDQMLELFPYLSNHVYTGSKRSIRWLRRVGFEIHPPVPYGAKGALFHPFDMRA